MCSKLQESKYVEYRVPQRECNKRGCLQSQATGINECNHKQMQVCAEEHVVFRGLGHCVQMYIMKCRKSRGWQILECQQQYLKLRPLSSTPFCGSPTSMFIFSEPLGTPLAHPRAQLLTCEQYRSYWRTGKNTTNYQLFVAENGPFGTRFGPLFALFPRKWGT